MMIQTLMRSDLDPGTKSIINKCSNQSKDGWHILKVPEDEVKRNIWDCIIKNNYPRHIEIEYLFRLLLHDKRLFLKSEYSVFDIEKVLGKTGSGNQDVTTRDNYNFEIKTACSKKRIERIPMSGYISNDKKKFLIFAIKENKNQWEFLIDRESNLFNKLKNFSVIDDTDILQHLVDEKNIDEQSILTAISKTRNFEISNEEIAKELGLHVAAALAKKISKSDKVKTLNTIAPSFGNSSIRIEIKFGFKK